LDGSGGGDYRCRDNRLARVAIRRSLFVKGGDIVGGRIDRDTFAYDMAAIAIPVAFLARDQLRWGLLRGEQGIAIGLFAVTIAVFMSFGDRQGGITFGSVPLASFVLVSLLAVVLRRVINEDARGSRPDLKPNFKEFETSLA
jgi:hypothetical protein